MTCTVRALPLLLLLPALLTACGTEKADAGDAPEPAPATARQPEQDDRLRASGIAPELVYVTEVPGFTLAQQSVGVSGDDGFSAAYWAKNGAILRLSAERGSAADCPEDHICRAPAKGHVVRISGEKVAPDVLRRAADAVHRPTPAELAALLPPAPRRRPLCSAATSRRTATERPTIAWAKAVDRPRPPVTAGTFRAAARLRLESVGMPPRLLLYTRTADYRHDSIPDAVAAVRRSAGSPSSTPRTPRTSNGRWTGSRPWSSSPPAATC